MIVKSTHQIWIYLQTFKYNYMYTYTFHDSSVYFEEILINPEKKLVILYSWRGNIHLLQYNNPNHAQLKRLQQFQGEYIIDIFYDPIFNFIIQITNSNICIYEYINFYNTIHYCLFHFLDIIDQETRKIHK